MACPRCHGTGQIALEVTVEQQRLLDELAEIGARRADATRRRQTSAGRAALDQAYAELRALEPTAKAAGLTREQIANAVGVSRTQLHNILSHRTADQAG